MYDIDQKEHKNNWQKFDPATWCYKHHPNVCVWKDTMSADDKIAFFYQFAILQ